MPVSSADIKFYLSGGSANTDPNQSLGGAISSTEVGTGDNNLFDDVSADEASSGDTEYRCIYVKNTNSSDSLNNAKIWIESNTPANDDIYIGLDSAGKNGTATTIADEGTAPSGVTFSQPTSYSDGLSLGNLAAGDYYAVWIKRSVPANCPSYSGNSFTLKVQGETA